MCLTIATHKTEGINDFWEAVLDHDAVLDYDSDMIGDLTFILAVNPPYCPRYNIIHKIEGEIVTDGMDSEMFTPDETSWQCIDERCTHGYLTIMFQKIQCIRIIEEGNFYYVTGQDLAQQFEIVNEGI